MHRGKKIYSYDAAVRCEGAKAEFLSLDGIISEKEFYSRVVSPIGSDICWEIAAASAPMQKHTLPTS